MNISDKAWFYGEIRGTSSEDRSPKMVLSFSLACPYIRVHVEAARQIAPVIRAHKDEAERERRFSKPALAVLTEAGLMQMLTPRSLGGMEVDPLTCARVVEEVAAADSTAG